jgi:DNA modification methylase
VSSTIHHGDCREVMAAMEAGSVDCCVTSPPYYGLRDYGHDGQIGLEDSPEEYVAKLVEVFREVRRVLRDDGTLWLNLGDSYWNHSPVRKSSSGAFEKRYTGGKISEGAGQRRRANGHATLKMKDLIGIPWRVAFALQADGWYLRQDIIWHKPNPMPESVTDRCTKAHEYVFLLSKSARYYYDAEAVKEPVAQTSIQRARYSFDSARERRNGAMPDAPQNMRADQLVPESGRRNKRSVWTIATAPYAGAHFAVMPPALVEPCILAGSRPGGLVLDPFTGSGTVGMVALMHGRRFVGAELNADYLALAQERIGAVERGIAEDARQLRMFGGGR